MIINVYACVASEFDRKSHLSSFELNSCYKGRYKSDCAIKGGFKFPEAGVQMQTLEQLLCYTTVKEFRHEKSSSGLYLYSRISVQESKRVSFSLHTLLHIGLWACIYINFSGMHPITA